MSHFAPLDSERDLVSAALALGARDVRGWSEAEYELQRSAGTAPAKRTVRALQKAIAAGDDPLGDAFCALRSPEERRPDGATYTPDEIVQSMVEWSANQLSPERVVDPGSGSARFAVAAGRRFRDSKLVAVELDPLAALLARAHLAAAGFADRSRVILADYRDYDFKDFPGRTLFIGNPPYVRHHDLATSWKEWLVREAGGLGYSASQLAGLHVYFMLQTALRASKDDVGVFITSAEWLDVNYGSLVRGLFLNQLGGESLHVIEPTAQPFEDAQTTAVISCFKVGSQPTSVRMRRVKKIDQLNALGGGQPVLRERLEEARRWTALTRPPKKMPEGFVQLGEIASVHRGQVTGRNATWVVGNEEEALPESVKYPSITRAHELFTAQTFLSKSDHLKRVVDIPQDLGALDPTDRKMVDNFLKQAQRDGAHESYVAKNRKVWWSVGLRDPAPILATYMARRPPAFVRNSTRARHINIAHGIYPREKMRDTELTLLAESLRQVATLGDGRMYAGGLTKFEPKEMERLPVPSLELLASR
ncbi:MAG: hypothetical protein WAP35_02190 [Solirubrobacterales bacterium]